MFWKFGLVWKRKQQKLMKMQASLQKEEEAEDGETDDVHRKQMETESDSTKRKGQDAQEKIDRQKEKKP